MDEKLNIRPDQEWPNPSMVNSSHRLTYQIDNALQFFLHGTFLTACAGAGSHAPSTWNCTHTDFDLYGHLVRWWSDNVGPNFRASATREVLASAEVANQALQSSWEALRWQSKYCARQDDSKVYFTAVKPPSSATPEEVKARQDTQAAWLEQHLYDHRRLKDKKRPAPSPPSLPRKRQRLVGRKFPLWVRQYAELTDDESWWVNQLLSLKTTMMDVDSPVDAGIIDHALKASRGLIYPRPTYHGADAADRERLFVSFPRLSPTFKRAGDHDAAANNYSNLSSILPVHINESQLRTVVALLMLHQEEIDTLFPRHLRSTYHASAGSGAHPEVSKRLVDPQSSPLLRVNRAVTRPLDTLIKNINFRPRSTKLRRNTVMRCERDPNTSDISLHFVQHESCTNGQHVHHWVQFLAALVRRAAFSAESIIHGRSSTGDERKDRWQRHLGCQYSSQHDGQSIYDLFDVLGLWHNQDKLHPTRAHFERRAAYYATPPKTVETLDGMCLDMNGDEIGARDIIGYNGNADLPEILDGTPIDPDAVTEVRSREGLQGEDQFQLSDIRPGMVGGRAEPQSAQTTNGPFDDPLSSPSLFPLPPRRLTCQKSKEPSEERLVSLPGFEQDREPQQQKRQEGQRAEIGLRLTTTEVGTQGQGRDSMHGTEQGGSQSADVRRPESQLYPHIGSESNKAASPFGLTSITVNAPLSQERASQQGSSRGVTNDTATVAIQRISDNPILILGAQQVESRRRGNSLAQMPGAQAVLNTAEGPVTGKKQELIEISSDDEDDVFDKDSATIGVIAATTSAPVSVPGSGSKSPLLIFYTSQSDTTDTDDMGGGLMRPGAGTESRPAKSTLRKRAQREQQAAKSNSDSHKEQPAQLSEEPREGTAAERAREPLSEVSDQEQKPAQPPSSTESYNKGQGSGDLPQLDGAFDERFPETDKSMMWKRSQWEVNYEDSDNNVDAVNAFQYVAYQLHPGMNVFVVSEQAFRHLVATIILPARSESTNDNESSYKHGPWKLVDERRFHQIMRHLKQKVKRKTVSANDADISNTSGDTLKPSPAAYISGIGPDQINKDLRRYLKLIEEKYETDASTISLIERPNHDIFDADSQPSICFGSSDAPLRLRLERGPSSEVNGDLDLTSSGNATRRGANHSVSPTLISLLETTKRVLQQSRASSLKVAGADGSSLSTASPAILMDEDENCFVEETWQQNEPQGSADRFPSFLPPPDPANVTILTRWRTSATSLESVNAHEIADQGHTAAQLPAIRVEGVQQASSDTHVDTDIDDLFAFEDGTAVEEGEITHASTMASQEQPGYCPVLPPSRHSPHTIPHSSTKPPFLPDILNELPAATTSIPRSLFGASPLTEQGGPGCQSKDQIAPHETEPGLQREPEDGFLRHREGAQPPQEQQQQPQLLEQFQELKMGEKRSGRETLLRKTIMPEGAARRGFVVPSPTSSEERETTLEEMALSMKLRDSEESGITGGDGRIKGSGGGDRECKSPS